MRKTIRRNRSSLIMPVPGCKRATVLGSCRPPRGPPTERKKPRRGVKGPKCQPRPDLQADPKFQVCIFHLIDFMRSGYFLDEESLFVAISDDLHVTSFAFSWRIQTALWIIRRGFPVVEWLGPRPTLTWFAILHARLNSICHPAAAWDSARAFYEYAWLV